MNNVDNYAKYAGLISVKDKTELYTLINNGIKLLGFDGNFNWIDTSEITDMSNLFYENFTFFRIFRFAICKFSVRIKRKFLFCQKVRTRTCCNRPC